MLEQKRDITVMCESQWREAKAAQESALAPYVKPHLERCSVDQRHPVVDFLFKYYSFKVSHLRRWSPGAGVLLSGPGAAEFLESEDYVAVEGGVSLDRARFAEKRMRSLHWVKNLNLSVEGRPGSFSCMGLHEWAMVYELKDIRHDAFPLRLPHDELRSIVEAGPIHCSHYDAFRFFSTSAISSNLLQPQKQNRAEMEQCGCLHVNMDLYKWAYKFYPWVSSTLITNCFKLAFETRTVDMCASPYDLSSLGFDPIKIETTEGKEEYVAKQKEISRKAVPLRRRLIEELEKVEQWLLNS